MFLSFSSEKQTKGIKERDDNEQQKDLERIQDVHSFENKSDHHHNTTMS